MGNQIDNLLLNFQGNGAAPQTVIAQTEEDIGFRVPSDYRAFLARYNGGEGFIGRHYLIAWPAEKIAQYNREYEVHEYAPGIVLFGSTGGGEGFGFDTRGKELSVVQIPFVGMDLRDAIKVANSFGELLSRMSMSDGPLF